VSQVSPDLHSQLRSATNDVHQRLHRHPGLAAVQSQTIDVARYRLLLRRLLGFHQPFEIAAKIEPDRSRRLARDIAFLEANDGVPVRPVRLCQNIPSLDKPDQILGALYVVEGSALGGRGLARNLDALLGAGVINGRRFFSGGGGETGAAWRAYLTRLAAVSSDPGVRQRIIVSATATFAAFEIWMRDWDAAG
jgi:heme oxygenase